MSETKYQLYHDTEENSKLPMIVHDDKMNNEVDKVLKKHFSGFSYDYIEDLIYHMEIRIKNRNGKEIFE